jgi:hypothetical protein
MNVLNKYEVASKAAPVVLSFVFTVVMSLKFFFFFFRENGLGGVYNEDRNEAMNWDEEVDNPYRTPNGDHIN